MLIGIEWEVKKKKKKKKKKHYFGLPISLVSANISLENSLGYFFIICEPIARFSLWHILRHG